MTNRVSIIIPLYTLSLTDDEWISIDRCINLLNDKYKIVFVVPEHLSIDAIGKRYKCTFRVERFEDEYFTSIKGYNRLMMSTEFYDRFLDSEYILIYQSDCYLFYDNLMYWCDKEYDYIGAAWIAKLHYTKPLSKLYIRLKKIFCKKYSFEHLKLAVGNGGLSLRRTRKFRDLTIDMSNEIDFYIKNLGSSIFNEDVFWSIEVNRKKRRLKIAPYNIALSFSFDDFPNIAYHLHGGKLPMGCHGWTKERCRDFYDSIGAII